MASLGAVPPARATWATEALRRWWGLAALGGAFLLLDLLCAALALALLGTRGPAILGTACNLAAALRFGVTLLPGREPLITRYGRCDPAGLPDADGAYTRRLTWLWAGLLGGFAAAFGLLAILDRPVGWLPAAELALCAALFLGEHAVRNRRFPRHGRASPARTLRAVRLAHQAPPDA